MSLTDTAAFAAWSAVGTRRFQCVPYKESDLMSQAIEILAFLGSSSEARGAEGLELERLLQSAGLEGGFGAMLMNADRGQIEGILQVNPTICCLVHAPDEEEAPHEEEGPEEGGDDEEGEDSHETDPRDG